MALDVVLYRLNSYYHKIIHLCFSINVKKFYYVANSETIVEHVESLENKWNNVEEVCT